VASTCMKLSSLDNVLWAAGFVANVSLLLIFLVRKRLKGFPGFIAYPAYKAAATVSLFVVLRYGHQHAYAVLYWISAYLQYPLQLWVIAEMARDVLHPILWWVRDVRNSILAWGTLGVVTAASLSLGIGPSGAKGFDLWENRASVFTSLVMCGLVVFLSAVAGMFHLRLRRHIVAMGLGLFALSYGVLLADLAHVILGWDRDFAAIGYMSKWLYLVVIVYWMVTFWNREKEPPSPSREEMAYMIALHERVKNDLDVLEGRHK